MPERARIGRKLVLLTILCSLSCVAQDTTAPDSEPHRESSMFTFGMYSTAVKDTMAIDVTLPEGYDTDSTVRYPVLYLTDGYWRRGQHQPIHDMARNENVKELIIVGIGCPDNYDSNVVPVRDLINNPGLFLDFILSRLIPTIDKDYRTNGKRTLWGSSYGGYFAMYTLFRYSVDTKGVFQHNIVARPAALETTDFGGVPTDLFGFEQNLASSTHDLNVCLYVTVGGNEDAYRFLNLFKRLVDSLSSRQYDSFVFKSFIDPGKDHYTVCEPTLYEGVRLFLTKS
jgi:predicted alpha/beta superfamily hydrolase